MERGCLWVALDMWFLPPACIIEPFAAQTKVPSKDVRNFHKCLQQQQECWVPAYFRFFVFFQFLVLSTKERGSLYLCLWQDAHVAHLNRQWIEASCAQKPVLGLCSWLTCSGPRWTLTRSFLWLDFKKALASILRLPLSQSGVHRFPLFVHPVKGWFLFLSASLVFAFGSVKRKSWRPTVTYPTFSHL